MCPDPPPLLARGKQINSRRAEGGKEGGGRDETVEGGEREKGKERLSPYFTEKEEVGGRHILDFVILLQQSHDHT